MLDEMKKQHRVGRSFIASVPEQEDILVVGVEFVNIFLYQGFALFN